VLFVCRIVTLRQAINVTKQYQVVKQKSLLASFNQYKRLVTLFFTNYFKTKLQRNNLMKIMTVWALYNCIEFIVGNGKIAVTSKCSISNKDLISHQLRGCHI
jgi:hypothetical protein